MITGMKTVQEHEKAGRVLVATEKLSGLRSRLGLSRLAMAELLNLDPVAYKKYEADPAYGWRIKPDTAARVGRFAYLAEITLTTLAQENVSLADLVPLHVVAMNQGIPQEVLHRWYRQGVIHAEDLGILGLWIHKDDLHYVPEAA